MKSNAFESIIDKKTWKKGAAHVAGRDKVMAGIIGRFGAIKLEWGRGGYEALVRSFISQQISNSAADSIFSRFMQLYGGRFPKPMEFLETPEEKVRRIGISLQKYAYIKDLSERLESGRLSLEELSALADDDVVKKLDEVKGIGRWTAEMFLIFSLNRTDIFPADDLVIMKAMQKEYAMRRLPDKRRMHAISRKWKPYRSIATIYLWQSVDGRRKPKRTEL